MNTLRTSLLFVLGLITIGVLADEDEYHERAEHQQAMQKQNRAMHAALPLYQNECGSCHLAYPPWFLPGKSWLKIMAELDRHFGDNAEIDAKLREELTHYLLHNSADALATRRSKRILRSIDADNTPLRITELAYFKREHNEIPARMVKGNDKVRSLSNCEACHRRAQQGSFREREIDIPGFGKWDD